MMPFPETEIMTLKRLEVAIRKMDFKLLKDGAYKLHEKYHSGHRFEYTDLLKQIYTNVIENNAVPNDIKDILIPTIEDILSQNQASSFSQGLPQALSQDLSQSILKEQSVNLFQNTKPESFQPASNSISAYEVFNGPHQLNTNTDKSINGNVQKVEQGQPFEFRGQEYPSQEYPNQEHITKPFQEFNSLAPIENSQTSQVPSEAVIQPSLLANVEMQEKKNETWIEEKKQIQKIKTISIFYGQESSKDKIRNILKLKELILKSKEEEISLNETLKLIQEIKTQANTNVSELKNVLEQFRTSKNKVNLITNSQSADLISLLKEANHSFSFLRQNENINLNFIPLFGLSNLFTCCTCRETYLNQKKDETFPLILSCPKCKSPMYPTLYAVNDDKMQIDINYYNYAVSNFAKSDIWLLIHPDLNDTFLLDMLKTVLNLSDTVEEIYILDKDINVKETYKKAFLESSNNRNIKIDIQTNAYENFYNSLNSLNR